MLLAHIQDTVNTSLKSGDTVVVETLRFLIAAIKTEAINKYGADAEKKITNEDVLSVIKKQVKTHRESVVAFEKAGRSELAKKEKDQLEVLEGYLPKELSDEELHAILDPLAKASGDLSADGANFGLLMGKAMKAVAGKASGHRVTAMLRSVLSNG